jgi:hypothetical protein
MKAMDNLIRVYSGNEVTVHLLKGRFDIEGIQATIRNDSNDSFLQGIPVAVDLYIQQPDLKKAEKIIREFIRKNKA